MHAIHAADLISGIGPEVTTRLVKERAAIIQKAMDEYLHETLITIKHDIEKLYKDYDKGTIAGETIHDGISRTRVSERTNDT